MRRLACASAALALAVLLLPACGSGSDSTTSSGASDYAAQLDSLCKKRDEQLKGISDQQPAQAQKQVAAVYSEFEDGVSSLEAPADLADAQAQLLGMLGQRPADTSDPEAYMQYYGKLDAIYSELGADTCRSQTEGVMGGAPGSAGGGQASGAAAAAS